MLPQSNEDAADDENDEANNNNSTIADEHDNNCTDYMDNCDGYANQCENEFVIKSCPKTCGICDEGYTTYFCWKSRTRELSFTLKIPHL